MNELYYSPIEEAEFLDISGDSQGIKRHFQQGIMLAMFLVSVISLAGWSTFQHVSANADYSSPWQLTVRPNALGATFQFWHRSTGRYSPMFQVKGNFAEVYDTQFYDGRCKIPGVVVEDFYADKYPGYVILSVGEVRFMVAKNGVEFNDVFYKWGNQLDEEYLCQNEEQESDSTVQ
jgi:hypothetical protein